MKDLILKQDNEKDWLTSNNRELVEIAAENTGYQAIHDVLRVIVSNFSPEECADIVITAFKNIVSKPDLKQDMIAWVKAVQSEEARK